MITGSPLLPAYLDLVEDLGGNVAGDDLCQGYRDCLPQVTGRDGGGDDPFLELARGYLQRPACPRMLAGRSRFAYLKELIRECRAQGVVYHALKFCDQFQYDYPTLRQDMEETGTPVLYLEGDYTTGGFGQMKTRVQAFVEMLGEM